MTPNWSDANNWQDSTAPVAGDTIVFPSSASNLFSYNDGAPGTVYASIDIQAANYDLWGNNVVLTGNLSGSLNSGQAVYELATTLDNGVISVASGGSLVASGKLSGESGLELTGGGNLRLRGGIANDYTGTTIVDNGTLTLENLSGRYAIPGPIVVGGSGNGVVHENDSRQINPTQTLTVNSNGIFNVDGNSETVGGLVLNGYAQVFTATSDGTLSGLLTLNGGITTNSNNVTATINGVLSLGSADRTVNVTAGELAMNATVQGTGSLDKIGAGQLTLNGSYQNPGAVNINSGTILFNNGGTINANSSGITVASGASAILRATGNVAVPISLAGDGVNGAGALQEGWYNDATNNITLTADTSIGSNVGNLIINGAISDNGSKYKLTKVGGGEVTLAGTNTYGGGTVVSNGLLYIGGSITGNVTTTSTGRLGGNAGSMGDVTTNGGTVDAGTWNWWETGILNAASLTLDSTSTFAAKLNGPTPGGNFDQWVVSGAVALNNANLSLSLNNYNPGSEDSLAIIKGATSLTGTFNGYPENTLITLNGNNNFLITYQGGAGGHDVVLNRVVTTTTTMTVPTVPSVFGQSVKLTASIGAPQGGIPLGTVSFYDGETLLGTSSLSSGVATLDTTALPVGADNVTAVYNGDAHSLTSNSNGLPVTYVVYKSDSTATFSISTSPAVYGQSVTLTANVAPVDPGGGNPDGTVSFFDGGSLLGVAQPLVGGIATYTTTAFATGIHNLSVRYSGSGNYLLSNSETTTETINQASTITGLISSTNPTVSGQSITFNAAVSAVAPGAGIPTGTVSFFDGNTLLGIGTLDNTGATTFSLSTLDSGMHSITAVYNGDTNDKTNTSSPVTQVVDQASTTTSLTASPTSAVFTQPVSLTATVVTVSPGSGIPHGTVSFFDGQSLLGSSTVDGTGVAILTLSNLDHGGHSITAVYNGDSNDTTSTSSAVGVAVTLGSTTTTITPSSSPAVFGQSVTISTTIASLFQGGTTPTGTVSFLDGLTPIGVATLDENGTASVVMPSVALGAHPLTVSYSGDGKYDPSISSPYSLQVNQANATPVITPPSSVVYGQTGSLTVNVAAASPGAGSPIGTISFYDGETLIGGGTLENGALTTSVSRLGVGTHSITAVYSGDNDFLTATSQSVNFIVNQSSTAGTLSPISAVISGQTFPLSVSFAPVSPGSGVPTGSVTFYSGQTVLANAVLSNGSASTTSLVGLPAGAQPIRAIFFGDSNFQSVTSNIVTLTVNLSQTTTTLSSSANIVFGQTGVIKATLAVIAPGSGLPTGTVTFYEGANVIGVSPVDGFGVATLDSSTLPLGPHTITASYSGDASYQPSSGTAINVSVTQASSSTTLTPPSAVIFGQASGVKVTVTAVAPSTGYPSGNVTFYEGQTVLGTFTLTAGSATLNKTDFSIGNHVITAIYAGDNSFTSSTASSVTLEVDKAATTATISPTSPIVFGQSATLSVTVTSIAPGSGVPSGTVTFLDGQTPIASGELDNQGTYSAVVPALFGGGRSGCSSPGRG